MPNGFAPKTLGPPYPGGSVWQHGTRRAERRKRFRS